MTRYAIATDLNRCTGCLACSVACKMANGVPVGSFWNKTLRIGPNKRAQGSSSPIDVEMYFLTVSCQHCANPACVDVCPTEASHKLEDGTVQIDKAKCIGCQFCAMACPYGVRYLNEEERVVEKCTLCEQQISQGNLPECVSQCVGRARYFGDLDEGLDSFVTSTMPAVGSNSYEDCKGARMTLAEGAQPYSDSDIHYLPNVGNNPSFVYILRDREWKGEE